MKRKKQPDLAQSKKEELKASLRTRKLDTMGWQNHRNAVDNATLPTNSNRLCYTYIEQPCLAQIRQAYRKQFPLIKSSQRGEQKKWRDTLDKETGNLCKAYAGVQARKDTAGCTSFTETADQNNR